MGATGTTTVNFGAFPGKSDASIAVTGQTGIVSGSLVEAWIRPVATADHTADEHMVEPLRVMAGNIEAGVGFTIYAFNANQIAGSDGVPGVARFRSAATSIYGTSAPKQATRGTRIYGQWTVAWVWN